MYQRERVPKSHTVKNFINFTKHQTPKKKDRKNGHNVLRKTKTLHTQCLFRPPEAHKWKKGHHNRYMKKKTERAYTCEKTRKRNALEKKLKAIEKPEDVLIPNYVTNTLPRSNYDYSTKA